MHSKHFPNPATSPAPRHGLPSDIVSKLTLNTPALFPLLLINHEGLTALLATSITALIPTFYSDESKLKPVLSLESLNSSYSPLWGIRTLGGETSPER